MMGVNQTFASSAMTPKDKASLPGLNVAAIGTIAVSIVELKAGTKGEVY